MKGFRNLNHFLCFSYEAVMSTLEGRLLRPSSLVGGGTSQGAWPLRSGLLGTWTELSRAKHFGDRFWVFGNFSNALEIFWRYSRPCWTRSSTAYYR